MAELLTAAQMRAIERAAIESGAVTGLELMERAGQGVVDAIFEEWPELAESGEGGSAPRPADSPRDISGERKRQAVVLCGPGNNGGDGFVVARLLHELGWDVEVFLYGDAEKLPPDAKANYERWVGLGAVAPYVDEGEAAFWLDPSSYREDSLLIDALFGTGLARPAETFNAFGWVTQMTEWRESKKRRLGHYPAPRVVSIDMASGICSDSGKLLSGAEERYAFEEIRADLTVSFHTLKAGHHLAQGPEQCGKVVVADIGLTHSDLGNTAARKALVEAFGEEKIGRVVCNLVDQPSPYIQKETDEHKYTHGHALILTGGAGKTGAARLAARGALRIGAGLVTLGMPPAAQMEVASQITALMLRRVKVGEGLGEILADPRFNALCLGPGLGGERARDLVPVALGRGGVEPRPTVLDADALTAFAETPEELFALLHEHCVLTPHGGEFARLFPDLAGKLTATPTKGPAYSKVDATREAARRAGCVVLFKGPDSVIAAPDGRCSINSAHYERAAPWLATAGSGDVLAGIITGLLARGFAPMQAAETAAYCHLECARAFGPGLIAEDLPEMLPQVFRELGM